MNRSRRIYIIYFLGIALLGVAVLPGCRKFLDKEPDNRTQIHTPDQIAQLLTTAYPGGNYIMFCEAMSDNAEDKLGGGSGYDFADKINRESYRYEVVEVAPDDIDGPVAYWNSCYKAIAAANQALELINAASDTQALAPHRGEALVARAYAHFMLVTLFAKVYDPVTAGNDPGIPYVTAPEKEIFVQYRRGTVASVYEMIENDLIAGYPLIDDRIYGQAPKFHFNKKAAAAFAARFFLFKRDYEKVVFYATQALGSNVAEELRPWNTSLSALQYAELEAAYTKSTTSGNLLLHETNSIWGRSYAALRYGLGEGILNRFIARPNATGGYYTYPVYGANPRVYNIPKFYEYFVTESLNANSGQPYNTIPLFTAEEALLNRAEAYLFLTQTGESLADLNTFASRNTENYNAAAHTLTTGKVSSFYGMPAQPAILNTILDFKRVFFLHEGMRWFDILRLDIPVIHLTGQGEVIELGSNDNRRALQLPPLTKQAGLEPNPR